MGDRGGVRGEVAAVAGLLLTAVCWGCMTPLTAVLLETLPPLVIAAGRYTLAAPLLAGIILLRERAPVFPLGLPWGRILLLGGAGIAGFATCYTLGVGYAGTITAAAILATQPVVAALIEWQLLRRPIARRTLTAIGLAVAGGLLVAFGQPARSPAVGHGGEALLVLGMFCWTWYSMKAQAWLAPLGIGQIRITLLTTGAAALCLWIAFGATLALGLQAPPAGRPGAGALAILLLLAVGPTAMAISTWNFGTARLGITVASLFLNLAPVVAVLLGVILGAEAHATQLAGGAVAPGGVVYLQLGGIGRRHTMATASD